MSRTWKSLSSRSRSTIMETAGALLLLDRLTPNKSTAQEDRPVTFRDLRAWLQSTGDTALPARLKLALASDPRLRHDFDCLLLRSASWHGPRASVASSGDLVSRDAAGFQLRIKPSRAASHQFYVLITLLGERDQDPTTLLIQSAAGECYKWNLPAPQSGVIQILVDETVAGLRLLRDPKSELFLW